MHGMSTGDHGETDHSQRGGEKPSAKTYYLLGTFYVPRVAHSAPEQDLLKLIYRLVFGRIPGGGITI